MEAAMGLAISADGHLSEPADLWRRGLPAPLRERGPRVEVRDGWVTLVVEGRPVRKLVRAAQGAADGPADLSRWGRTDPEERLRTLEGDGVWAEVMYPNVAFFTAWCIEDPALQEAVCAVYDDWVADAFGGSPRLAPVGLLPAADVDAALRELRRLPELGLRAALLPAHCDHRPWNDPAWEPLWETAESLGVPLSFHAGTGRGQTPYRGPGGAVANYVSTVSGPMETVALLCASGVLERHPGLRVVMVECGAGWLAWALEAMDDAYREHHMFVRPRLRELPSACFRRQGAVTFQRDPVGVANLARTGARCLLWGSDYPHPEGTFPHSREVLAEQLRDVPREQAELVVWRNAAELYRLPPPPDHAPAPPEGGA